ncbi:MAG: DNA methyltransferase [Candidatus Zixiibacteriota bacterium]
MADWSHDFLTLESPDSLLKSFGRKRFNAGLLPADYPIHNWYRFVLAYPPEIVDRYTKLFALPEGATVLDPFCGTGTTLIQSRLNGMKAIGVEANPVAAFASNVKLDWSVDPKLLLAHAHEIADVAERKIADSGFVDSKHCKSQPPSGHLRTVADDKLAVLITNSISPLPLHKALILLELIDATKEKQIHGHLRLVFAKCLVFSYSNLRFGPEVGLGKVKVDTPVVGPWLQEIERVAADICALRRKSYPEASVIEGDARQIGNLIEPGSVDAVITSPPYPNEKDYTRTTRLESVILGFVNNKAELRLMKKGLLRSNTRGAYKEDEDDLWVSTNDKIDSIATEIERRRLKLGKTSGFEKLYARVTKLYFGGMTRHFAELRRALRPGAKLAYVVGDQASYLQVMIKTGELLGEIASELGYQVDGIDLYRMRAATATRSSLREEVIRLSWKG